MNPKATASNNKKQQGSKVEMQKSQLGNSQIGKKSPKTQKSQYNAKEEIVCSNFNDDKKTVNKTSEKTSPSESNDKLKKCDKKGCKEGKTCKCKKECAKCEGVCGKKKCENKKKSGVVVKSILFLMALLAITMIQAIYFIVEVDGAAGNKFFANIKRYFISHSDARVWLRFSALFSTLFEFIMVAFKLMNFAAFILNCSIKFVFRIIAGLIIPLALVISMIFIVNYSPDIIPSQIQVITKRIPKLPENIKAKIDPVLRYLASTNFQGQIDHYAKAIVGVFKRK